MIFDDHRAQIKVKELFETGQINEETYRDMLADIYMWGKDCEYEVIEEGNKWEMKIIPLMALGY